MTLDFLLDHYGLMLKLPLNKLAAMPKLVYEWVVPLFHVEKCYQLLLHLFNTCLIVKEMSKLLKGES